MEAEIINMPLHAAIERATFSKNKLTSHAGWNAPKSQNITHKVLLWKDCKFSLWTTGIFTCSVSNCVTCFIGVLCVTGTVDSLACAGLLCLVVASLIVAACFPQVWGRFIPVEIIRSVYYNHQNKPRTITKKTNMYISLLKSARGMRKRYFSFPHFCLSSASSPAVFRFQLKFIPYFYLLLVKNFHN